MKKYRGFGITWLLLIGITGCQSSSTGTSAPNSPISCVSIGVESIQECTINSTNSSTRYGFNNFPYALCSQTLCTMSESSSLASCVCPLINESGWQSASLSPNTYGTTQPTYDNAGILQSVQSNYSMANYPPPIQSCTFDTPHPWASCFGVRCSVSANRESAICSCPIEYSSQFIMENPSSECQTTANQIWSAAAEGGSGYNDMLLVYQALYPNAPVLINTTGN